MIELLKKLGKAWTLITERMDTDLNPISKEHGKFGSAFSTHVAEDRVIIIGKNRILEEAECKAHVTWTWAGFYNDSGIVNMSIHIESVVLYDTKQDKTVWSSKTQGFVCEERWYTNKAIRPYAVHIDVDNKVCTVEFLSEL